MERMTSAFGIEHEPISKLTATRNQKRGAVAGLGAAALGGAALLATRGRGGAEAAKAATTPAKSYFRPKPGMVARPKPGAGRPMPGLKSAPNGPRPGPGGMTIDRITLNGKTMPANQPPPSYLSRGTGAHRGAGRSTSMTYRGRRRA